jgi:hypothetical protein
MQHLLIYTNGEVVRAAICIAYDDRGTAITSQSREMEQLIARGDDGSTNNVSNSVEKLVAKHVTEVAALERRWDAECADLKRNQRRDYRADVVELYSEMLRRRSGAAAAAVDTRPLLSNRGSQTSVQRTAAVPSDTGSDASVAASAAASAAPSTPAALASSVKRGALSLLKFGRKETAKVYAECVDAARSSHHAHDRPIVVTPAKSDTT